MEKSTASVDLSDNGRYFLVGSTVVQSHSTVCTFSKIMSVQSPELNPGLVSLEPLLVCKVVWHVAARSLY